MIRWRTLLSPVATAATTAAALTVTVTATAWFGVLAPARGEARRAATAVVRLAEAEAADAQAHRSLEEARGRVTKLAALVSEGIEPGRLEHRNARLAGLLTVAETAGLEVLRIDPGAPRPEMGHAEVSIDLEVRGPYASHHRFLGSVGEGPADLSVASFRLYGPPGGVLSGGYRLRWVVVDGPAGPGTGGIARP